MFPIKTKALYTRGLNLIDIEIKLWIALQLPPEKIPVSKQITITKLFNLYKI